MTPPPLPLDQLDAFLTEAGEYNGVRWFEDGTGTTSAKTLGEG